MTLKVCVRLAWHESLFFIFPNPHLWGFFFTNRKPKEAWPLFSLCGKCSDNVKGLYLHTNQWSVSFLEQMVLWFIVITCSFYYISTYILWVDDILFSEKGENPRFNLMLLKTDHYCLKKGPEQIRPQSIVGMMLSLCGRVPVPEESARYNPWHFQIRLEKCPDWNPVVGTDNIDLAQGL